MDAHAHAKLAEIRQEVERARSMPMSASAVVNRGELLGMLDELESHVSEAFGEAQKVVSERDSVIAEGRREADQIVRDAHEERDRVISETEVFRVAKQQASEVVIEAEAEASELRKETDEYVDSKLANFEIALDHTMNAVKRGRDRIAGRSTMDSLTEGEADKVKLPEHLGG